MDLKVPSFSHPTEVTNPLFPVSTQHAVVFVGHVDYLPFRTEVTLPPDTRVIEWGGQRVERLISQYTAYLDGRIQEVAYNLYAQANDGSVWYFGEDVADLENGTVVTKEAPCRQGRPGTDDHALRSLGRRRLPDREHPRDRVRAGDREAGGHATGRNPRPRPGNGREELHEDGSTESKQFARGYGEYFTGDHGDVEALALAVPTDASPQPMPTGLTRLYADARNIVHTGPSPALVRRLSGDWAAVPVTTHRR